MHNARTHTKRVQVKKLREVDGQKERARVWVWDVLVEPKAILGGVYQPHNLKWSERNMPASFPSFLGQDICSWKQNHCKQVLKKQADLPLVSLGKALPWKARRPAPCEEVSRR